MQESFEKVFNKTNSDTNVMLEGKPRKKKKYVFSLGKQIKWGKVCITIESL